MGAADPGLFALKGALRAALVLPLAFALGLYALDSKQAGLFASFGTMAMLVFVDFGGSRRARLGAYSALVAAGLPLVAVGTLCSRSPALATVAMALVAFAILFAGVLDGYVAAAHSAALLAFVLPVMVPAPPSALPDRLAGWAIAGVLSVAAEMLLWPMRPRGAIRTQAADTARALAAAVQARAGDSVAAAAASETARAAIRSLRARFVSLPHRPSGTASRTAALAHLVEDLGWLAPIAARAPAPGDREPAFSTERAEIEAAVPQALRSVAARLELGEEHGAGDDDRSGALGALERVRTAHQALGDSLIACFGGPGQRGDEALASVELDEAYRLRELSFGTLQTGRDALLSCGVRVQDDPLGTLRARIGATGRLARTHATMRSVWLRNSVRGAVGLAVAVLIGQLSDLQHAFWIVLGTMSVLRSNALATGTQAVSALLGTVGGIALGGLLVVAVGDRGAALWAILPLSVALAAYAPTAISFAAGQAAFSLLVLILFNLIDPTGWRVGLVRVEDVLLGASVSLLAGALIWPRGATAVLRRDVGDAYARAADYLQSTVDAMLDAGEVPPRAERAAAGSAELLDETVRDYLTQRSSTRNSLGDLAVLVAGAARARLVAGLLAQAQAFARLSPVTGGARLRQARDAFAAECRAVCQWYASLGHAISTSQTPPAPQRSGPIDLSAPPARVVLEHGDDSPDTPPGVALAWAHHHLAMLTELEADLALAGGRLRRPPATPTPSPAPRCRAPARP